MFISWLEPKHVDLFNFCGHLLVSVGHLTNEKTLSIELFTNFGGKINRLFLSKIYFTVDFTQRIVSTESHLLALVNRLSEFCTITSQSKTSDF